MPEPDAEDDPDVPELGVLDGADSDLPAEEDSEPVDEELAGTVADEPERLSVR